VSGSEVCGSASNLPFDHQTPRTYYDNRVNLIFKVGWSESATFMSGLIASIEPDFAARSVIDGFVV
jgi:hypothetical protein